MGKISINNEIFAENAYQGCAEVFAEYSREKDIKFKEGTYPYRRMTPCLV